MKHKLESRLPGEISITSDDTTLMAESEEELKSLLMKVKEESEKSWLKTQHSKNKDHGIWSHHFMAKDGTTVETVTDFIFLSSKITADTGCRHEIKSFLLWNDLLIGCMEKVQTLFFGAPKSLQMVIAAIKLKDAYSLEGKL